MKTRILAAAASLCCLSIVCAGPEWVEPKGNDAGGRTTNFQTPSGSGTLGAITGSIDGPSSALVPEDADYEDMYLIQIEDPASFTASTSFLFDGAAEFDSRLQLFAVDGTGLLSNDDTGFGVTLAGIGDEEGAEPCFGDLDGDGFVDFFDVFVLILHYGPCEEGSEDCLGDLNGDGFVGFIDLVILFFNFGACDGGMGTDPGSTFGPMSTDGTEVEVSDSGLYLLAVSVQRRQPKSNSGIIFKFAQPDEVSGPDGPGGMDPIEDWVTTAGIFTEPPGPLETGAYQIILTGCSFPTKEAMIEAGLMAADGEASLGVKNRR